MIKAQVYFEASQLQQLKAVAAQEGVAYSELVRQAVDDLLKETRKKSKKKETWSEMAKRVSTDMGGNVASRIDEMLYE